jgi:hypothetical protein
MPTPAILFAALAFGLIGLVAFNWGRKNALYGPMVLGLGLMVFPYFVSQTWAVYAVGTGLCAALFFWRD